MATLLGLLAAAVVLFLAAVVATREGPVLSEAVPDAPDVGLPPDAISGADVQRLRFHRVARGYRAKDVDEALERLSEALDERDARIAELESARTGGSPEPAEPGPAGHVPAGHVPAGDVPAGGVPAGDEAP